jgi:crossover junction endodeoxyribonuclease RuvC
MPIRVLGIDCGTERTGYGVIESDGVAHRMIASGVIRTDPKHSLASRLCEIAGALRAVIEEYQPQDVAVEDVFLSVNTKSALKLAHVRGVAMLTAAQAGLSVGEYSPMEVKTSVVGYGRAEKSQVQLMVRLLLSLERDLPEDASDAVAVAVCHATKTCSLRSLGAVQ